MVVEELHLQLFFPAGRSRLHLYSQPQKFSTSASNTDVVTTERRSFTTARRGCGCSSDFFSAIMIFYIFSNFLVNISWQKFKNIQNTRNLWLMTCFHEVSYLYCSSRGLTWEVQDEHSNKAAERHVRNPDETPGWARNTFYAQVASDLRVKQRKNKVIIQVKFTSGLTNY